MAPPEHCGDCRVERGALHEIFCTKELCPFCMGQLASCECIHAELKLTPEQSEAVWDYIDDSVDPLKTIIARWRAALDAKGRIRFGDDLKLLGLDG